MKSRPSYQSSIIKFYQRLDTCKKIISPTLNLQYDNRVKLLFSNPSSIKEFFLDENRVDKLKKEISKKSPLIRAILSKNKRPNFVIDLTGGFGFDTIQIACYGINVIYVEKNPVVFFIFNEFLSRIGVYDIKLATRIKTINMDSILFCDLVGTKFPYPDTVYIDPMFPENYKRKAKEKKYMQVLKTLIKLDDQKEEELFERAYSISNKKIIIKRPAKITPSVINARYPTYKIKARGHRFDVYVK